MLYLYMHMNSFTPAAAKSLPPPPKQTNYS